MRVNDGVARYLVVVPRIFACQALALAILLTAGCNGDSTPVLGRGATGERGLESLVVIRGSDAVDLDPAKIVDEVSLEVAAQIYEGLVTWNAESNQAVPALAIGWQSEASDTRWQFRLREGVRFHDGTTLDANAVVASFARQIDPSHPAYVGSRLERATPLRRIREVVAVDVATVRFELTAPDATFAEHLAMPAAAIVSSRAIELDPSSLTTHPVGTGPFAFQHWEPGRRIALMAYSDYWNRDRRAHARRLVFEVEPVVRQRLVALESGTADIATGLTSEEQDYVQLHPRLQLVTGPVSGVMFLALNTSRAPLDDLRVRQAISSAIDQATLVARVYPDAGVAATTALPPTMTPQVPPAARLRDPKASMAQLAAVAQSEGHPLRTLRLFVPQLPQPYLLEPDLVADVLVANFKQAGIEVELVRNRQSAADVDWLRDFDLAVVGWVAGDAEASAYLEELFSDRDQGLPSLDGSPSGEAMLGNGGLAALLAEARAEALPARRELVFEDIETRLLADLPWIPLAHMGQVYGIRTDLRNFVVGANGFPNYAALEFGQK